MIAEITAALSSASNALNLAKSIQKISTDVQVNQVMIELQQNIIGLQTDMLAAQSKMDELAKAKSELESKLKEKEQWEEEKKRYCLVELAPGILVYALKADDKAGEPSHYLCPNCFQKNHKSILQRPSVISLSRHCHNCDFNVVPTRQPTPPVRRATGESWVKDY